jgi:hypothetical protein
VPPLGSLQTFAPGIDLLETLALRVGREPELERVQVQPGQARAVSQQLLERCRVRPSRQPA